MCNSYDKKKSNVKRQPNFFEKHTQIIRLVKPMIKFHIKIIIEYLVISCSFILLISIYR
jgi:hypothetical protein